VWSWHPLLVSSRRRRADPNRDEMPPYSPAMVTRRIRRQGATVI
jgi:hypothetical protein